LPPADSPRPELHAIAHDKLTRVFGRERGEELLTSVLLEAKLKRIDTTDDLLRVADALKKRGGFIATTGVILEVQAMMRRP